MAKTNGEGLTWDDWKNAAGFHEESNPSTAHLACRAWEDGEDPTDWRATRTLRTINDQVCDLRDLVEKEARRIIGMMHDQQHQPSKHPTDAAKALDALVEQVAVLHDHYYKRHPSQRNSLTPKVRKLLGYTYP